MTDLIEAIKAAMPKPDPCGDPHEYYASLVVADFAERLIEELKLRSAMEGTRHA